MFLFLALVSVFDGLAHAQVDCSQNPDGSYGWGCKSYTRCEGGEGTVVDCLWELVYNDQTGECDNPMNVGPPCGLVRDCTGLNDGMHPDLVLNCTAFYTCLGGEFKGHNPCNPGLVFNDDPQKQVCDWPYNVLPPCGTKGTRRKPKTGQKQEPKQGPELLPPMTTTNGPRTTTPGCLSTTTRFF